MPIVSIQPLDVFQVPATVQALLAARINQLPPEDKRLLQTAAVIGSEVPWPLLQAIRRTADEALYRSLAQLQAAEFLYETSLFPDAPTPSSTPSPMRCVRGYIPGAAARAARADRRALEALAGDRRDDQVERLAQHALRGEVWEKALAYGRQAGDKARHARPTARRWCATSRRWRPWSISPTVVRLPSRLLTSDSAYPGSMPWAKH